MSDTMEQIGDKPRRKDHDSKGAAHKTRLDCYSQTDLQLTLRRYSKEEKQKHNRPSVADKLRIAKG